MNLFSSFAGVYSLCDSPAISSGPFLGTALLCSLASVIILSVKACVFSPISEIETDASPSSVRERLHLKISCGMPILFLSSLVFALGHTVVAYRTSCRARRKLLIHRADPEAVCFVLQLYVQMLICAVFSCLLAGCHTVCILLKITNLVALSYDLAYFISGSGLQCILWIQGPSISHTMLGEVLKV